MRPNPLRLWRETAGLKAVEIALKLDLSEQSVLGYEKGRFNPSESNFEKLAQIMEIEVSRLRAQWGFWKREQQNAG